MKVQPEDYRRAAVERLSAARELHSMSLHAEAIYFAGVAAECILRAHHQDPDAGFDGRHDLRVLFDRAIDGLAGNSTAYQQRLSAAVGELWARWKNVYRYLPGDRILGVLRDAGLTRRVRGDQLKECSRRAYDAAATIVNRGVARWNR